MSTKAKIKAMKRYRRGRKAVFGSRGFLSSMLAGFGAFALIGETPPLGRHYPSNGIEDDWRAVGDDLRVSMKRYEQRQTAA